jgi:hypothetical protein
MFDSPGDSLFSEGFLGKRQRSESLRLEALEDRAVPAVISGFVYNDVNNNGIKDPTEVGIAGSTVDLKDNAGRTIATAVSDSTGFYQFTQRTVGVPGPSTMTQEAIFADTRTNSNRTASINQFNPALGRLTKIEIIGEGAIKTLAQVENLSPNVADLDVHLKGNMRFSVGGVILTSTPERDLTAQVAAFDGEMDLAGVSAKNFGQTTVTGQFTTEVITNSADMAAFMGTGTLNVASTAQMRSCACGPGNLLAMIQSLSSGRVRVVYHYTPSNEIGPGQYMVVQRTQPVGYIDGLETDDNLAPIPNSNRTDFIRVNITDTNQVAPNNNFGERRPATPPDPIRSVPGKYTLFASVFRRYGF